MSYLYKKINDATAVDNDLEKSSFIRAENQQPQQISFKPAKKTNYGSLRTETQQTRSAKLFIVNHQHKLTDGETLQGISLKYDVPIDVIKRANRLWNNDLAFVKEFLTVPIEREKLKALNIECIDSRAVSASSSIQSVKDNNEEKEEYKNFLDKFDSLISESKIKLKHLENNSNLSIKDSSNLLATNTIQTLNSISKHQHDDGQSSNSMSASNFNSKLSTENVSCSNSLDFLIRACKASKSHTFLEKEKNNSLKLKTINNGVHINNSSSRSRIAHDNLLRLEKEKDALYEL